MSTATSLPHRRATAAARAEVLTVDYYLHGDTMIVASATTPGKLYIVTASGCTCAAGRREQPCKHAAYRLDKLHPRQPRQPMSAEQYAQACAAADECY